MIDKIEKLRYKRCKKCRRIVFAATEFRHQDFFIQWLRTQLCQQCQDNVVAFTDTVALSG
jgi:hypothetical protein